MKKITILIFLMISLMLFGCVSQETEVQDTHLQDNSQDVQDTENAEQNILDEEPIDEEAQLANPASVYCEEQEGILEIRTGKDGGQTGYCVFIDDETGEKSECEEWAFYRSECIIEDEYIEDDEDIDKEFDYGIDIPDTPSNEICGKLPLTKELNPGGRHYCLALVNHDARFCEKIDDEENEVNICFAHAKADSSYCKKIKEDSAEHIGDPAKHVCYYMLAVSSENIDFCDEITYDTHEREECYFSFVSNLYWFDESDEITTEYCNKFDAGEQKNTCLAFKNRDVSLCKNNVNCLTFFEQPASFCTDKGSILKECVRNRAMTSKDLSICETLTGEKKDDCIGDFCTHIQLDTAICDKISDNIERQSRYVEVAMNLGNGVRKG